MRFQKLAGTAGALALLLALGACAHARGADATGQHAVTSLGVFGMTDAQLSPEYWIARLARADEVLLTRAAIDDQNERLFKLDDSMHDLGALPPLLDRNEVEAWITGLSARPEKPLYDVGGAIVAADVLDSLVSELNLAALPRQRDTRYGLVVRRASLRTFPTNLRVFGAPGDTDIDIDRFQESALFPGTPVVIAHESRNGEWLFVLGPNYAAWVESRNVAEGSRQVVLAHAGKTPFRVVTGARVTTVFTREEPRVSELQLDMGTRLPLAAVRADEPVNGQHPYSSWPIELPVRAEDGSLSFSPALLQKNSDNAGDYLPLTRANLIRQAFKFLGERYGWGHSHNGRDCSGFVSEVYRSMGVELPRNTGDQAASPALRRVDFEPADSRAKRVAAVSDLEVGDLIYIPGHMLMMIGRIDGKAYVIHDTNGGSYLDAEGRLASLHLNAVSVTPLEPLQFSASETYIDRITTVVRIRP